MSKASDVNDCFDSAFYTIRKEHPNPDKRLGPDYSMEFPTVSDLLRLTRDCLNPRGWVFTFNDSLIDKCIPETVAKVRQDISANTKQAKQPAAAAKKPASAPKKKPPK